MVLDENRTNITKKTKFELTNIISRKCDNPIFKKREYFLQCINGFCSNLVVHDLSPCSKAALF